MISASVTCARKEDITLDFVPYIHYLVHFWKSSGNIEALIDFGSEVNAITPTYTLKLGLRVQKTDIGAQKIDGSSLAIYRIVVAVFQVKDKPERFRFFRFFRKTILLVDSSLAVILEKPFLFLRRSVCRS